MLDPSLAVAPHALSRELLRIAKTKKRVKSIRIVVMRKIRVNTYQPRI